MGNYVRFYPMEPGRLAGHRRSLAAVPRQPRARCRASSRKRCKPASWNSKPSRRSGRTLASRQSR
jgi:hypothetical protein